MLHSYTINYTKQVYECLWIRNCSAYSEPIISHALGGLAGNRRTLKVKRLKVATFTYRYLQGNPDQQRFTIEVAY